MKIFKLIISAGIALFCVTNASRTLAQQGFSDSFERPRLPKGLNDTGISYCGLDDVGVESPCTTASTKGQDAHSGRDLLAMRGELLKQGKGAAGFDFTKISNSGSTLPADATPGEGAGDWACTRDNLTGLVWEVKKNDPSHYRHFNHR